VATAQLVAERNLAEQRHFCASYAGGQALRSPAGIKSTSQTTSLDVGDGLFHAPRLAPFDGIQIRRQHNREGRSNRPGLEAGFAGCGRSSFRSLGLS